MKILTKRVGHLKYSNERYERIIQGLMNEN